jgi:hypothetical protein
MIVSKSAAVWAANRTIERRAGQANRANDVFCGESGVLHSSLGCCLLVKKIKMLNSK